MRRDFTVWAGGCRGLRRATLTLAVLLLLAPPAGAAADRVLAGGVVHTPQGPRELAVVVEDGRIAALVSAAQAGRLAEEGVPVVELAGARVLPGLVDAHLHLTGYGAALETVDLRGAATWDEVVRRAAAAAGALPPGAWVVGRGWDQNLWPEKTFPDRAALDRALPEHPVMLRRVDGHAAVVNARALALAGVGADTADPAGGRVLRRDDGTPSGVLVDSAMELVGRAVPPPSAADIERRILRAAAELASLGLTGVHDAGTTAAELAVLRRLERDRRLPIRVYVMLDGSDADLLARELPRGPSLAPGRLRIGAVKLYADGALGSRGALLGAPYADEPERSGLAVTSVEDLGAMVRRIARAGFQAAVHAIGDEGVHRTLDAFAGAGVHRSRRLRHRVEHAQVVRPEDVARFAALGVVASVQPTHCTSDMPWAPERLGAERIPWAYRWSGLQAAGARLAGGSDAPVESPDPRLALHAAMTRQRTDGTPEGGWNPAERLGGADALALLTTGAAWAGRAEGFTGQIAPGFAADLTIVVGDPLAAPLDLEVVRTVVEGRDVWVRPAGGGDD